MEKIRAAITGIHGWVPEYRLTNHELSKMVDTSDEWIMQRVGIKERRILKGEGLVLQIWVNRLCEDCSLKQILLPKMLIC